jgi:predicted nucleotide-binding protein (sugar kinase/HSP70/actin superfamily)
MKCLRKGLLVTVPKAMELIRNWALLVDHDIPDDHIAHLAQLLNNETEKEKHELLKRLQAISKKTLTFSEKAVEAAWEKMK